FQTCFKMSFRGHMSFCKTQKRVYTRALPIPDMTSSERNRAQNYLLCATSSWMMFLRMYSARMAAVFSTSRLKAVIFDIAPLIDRRRK
ncbi:MAG: hypothetical protein LBS62_00980, partial [Clostridiales bacterium]|nr:hypothetical protein [Clostridiales bacterium]